ncbi:tRNA selenocysteine 1-associated protein 1 [Astyanax mexicanus]|uniref:tRNA selenocysteine 1-associated protein 1 n=1 Tax=Astyanax mexicanus TaxID=7994 RepID=A0A8B9HWR5_ASTMX|nr:tRNA selenocysteine 1-associated protein 1 [Astyanax mexicanus]
MSCLWMGNLEPYMDEQFVSRAFATMGELVVSVRIIRNKINLASSGYCFVELTDEATAERCLRKVNGKLVPGAMPPKRFKLNKANYGKHGANRNKSGCSQPYPYDQNQHYQQYSDPSYYSSWGYDQNAGSYGGYNYSSYNICDQDSYTDMHEDGGLEEPTVDLDVVAVNRQFLEDSEELYDALIECHWPALDLPHSPE